MYFPGIIGIETRFPFVMYRCIGCRPAGIVINRIFFVFDYFISGMYGICIAVERYRFRFCISYITIIGIIIDGKIQTVPRVSGQIDIKTVCHDSVFLGGLKVFYPCRIGPPVSLPDKSVVIIMAQIDEGISIYLLTLLFTEDPVFVGIEPFYYISTEIAVEIPCKPDSLKLVFLEDKFCTTGYKYMRMSKQYHRDSGYYQNQQCPF